MKKTLLTFATLLAGITAVNGQIFSEDFSGLNGSLPAGWQVYNVDGLTPNTNVAYVTNAWVVRDDVTGTGDTVALSTSWYTPAGTSNDWLATPAISLTTANLLTWDENAPDASYADGYELYISTSGNAVADFTGVNGAVIYSTPGASSVWTQRSVDLGALGYSNQTVYLAWRNNSNDKFILMIDNISIDVLPAYDIEMQAMDSEYTIHPLSQINSPIGTDGVIENLSSNNVTNVTMTVNVYDGTMTSVYNAAATPLATLAPGATANFTVPGYTPTVEDVYTIEYIASMTETDGDMSNDTVTYIFAVSDSVYARDNANVSGTLGIGAGNGGDLGQTFELNASDDLTSVSIFIGNTTGNMVGQPLYARIWSVNGTTGAPDLVLGTTDTIIMDATANTLWTLNIDGGPMALAAGTYVITCAETDSNITIGTTTDKFTLGTTWVNWPTNPNGGWSNNEDFGFNSSYVLRANFGDPCANPTTASYSFADVGLAVNFTDMSASATSWLWDFGDGNTSTMQNPVHTYATDGSYTVCLTVTDACGTDSTCMTVTVSSCTSGAAYSFVDNGFTVDFTDVSVTNGTTTWAWDFGDGNTSTLQNPSHTYAANGTYTVCLTITDSCGTDSTCQSVTVFVDGIEDYASQAVQISPNPTNSVLNVATLDGTLVDSYNVYDMNGRIVMTGAMNAAQFNLNVESLNKGLYILEMKSDSNVFSTRFVKE